MQKILKILLVPALWLLFVLVLKMNFPQTYAGAVEALQVNQVNWQIQGGVDPKYPQRLLSDNRNFLYWLFFRSKLQQPFEEDAIFKKTKISPCSTFNLFCYNIEIEARRPAFIQKISGVPWLVDAEGITIRPINKPLSWKLPEVQLEQDHENAAPQIIQSRHRLAYRLTSKLKILPNLTLASLSFTSNGEVALTFNEYVFQAVLDVKLTEPAKIDQQIKRLKFIVEDLGAALSAVGRIDLAFERQAVITPLASVSEAKS